MMIRRALWAVRMGGLRTGRSEVGIDLEDHRLSNSTSASTLSTHPHVDNNDDFSWTWSSPF
jgi:hypothetical protein